MGIPAKVQQAAEDADKSMAALVQNPEPPATEPANDTPEPSQTADTTPSPDDRQNDISYWRGKYNGMIGFHRQQMNKMQAQMNEMAEELQRLKSQPVHQEPTKTNDRSRRVTEKDVEAFGSDLIDVIGRRAQDEIDAATSTLREQIVELQRKLDAANRQLQTVSTNVVEDAQTRFYAELERSVPTWQALQETQECQQFLSSVIPGTRLTWDEALKDAAYNANSGQAVEVFEQFLKLHPQFDERAKANAKARKDQQVQRQVAPAKANTSAPTTEGTDKRVYSAKEFDDDMLRVTRLSKLGKFDEANKLEAELNLAIVEGRVRPV